MLSQISVISELLLEICYEDLTADPDPYLKQVLEFIDEDFDLLPSQKGKTHPEKNKYKSKRIQIPHNIHHEM